MNKVFDFLQDWFWACAFGLTVLAFALDRLGVFKALGWE